MPMGFLDRLFGAPEPDSRPEPSGRSDDEIALERYRYLLRTAPPDQIERVHTDAFAQLTPQQRDLLFEELTRSAPEGDAPRSADAAALAASATRSELRRPGTLERTMGSSAFGGGGGPSFGSMFASSLLGSVAGYVIGSAIMSAFLPDPAGVDGGDAGGAEGADSAGGAGGAENPGDASADGGDWGGGFGDFGGDLGDF
jgi:hypothetical protein